MPGYVIPNFQEMIVTIPKLINVVFKSCYYLLKLETSMDNVYVCRSTFYIVYFLEFELASELFPSHCPTAAPAGCGPHTAIAPELL